MKISSFKREIKEWLKAFIFAVLAWSLFLIGLASSTKVHEWHLAEKNAHTVVVSTEQANK